MASITIGNFVEIFNNFLYKTNNYRHC